MIERKIIEAEMAGKREQGRTRLKVFDWMMKRFIGC